MGQDVIFVLKLAADPKNAQTAKATEKIVIDSQERINKAYAKTAAESTKEEKKAAEARDKIRENSFKLQMRQGEQARRAREKEAEDDVKAAKKASDDKKKLADKDAKQAQQTAAKSLREYETSLSKQVAAHASAQASIASGQQRTLAGISQTIEGGTQLTRAFALLGLAGEENLEKALRTFAKIEAAGQATKGIIQVVNGITSAYMGYSAAVKGATASQAALSAVEAASASRAAAGAAGRTATSAVGGAAGGVAASAATGAGGAALAAGGGGVAATVGIFAAKLLAAVGAVVLFTEAVTGASENQKSLTQTTARWSNSFDQWVMSFTGSGMWGGPSVGQYESGQMNERLSKVRRRNDQQAIDLDESNRTSLAEGSFASGQADSALAASIRSARADAEFGLAGNDRALAGSRAELQKQQGNLSNRRQESAAALSQSETGDRAIGNQVVALRNQEAALEGVIRAQQEVANNETALQRARVEAAQKELTASKASLELVNDRLRAIEAERTSALGTLSSDALKDPVAAQNLLEAARAARAGKEVSFDQSRALQGSGLSEFAPAIQAAQEKEINARGLGELIQLLNQQATATRQQRTEIEQKVTVDSNIVVTLESDLEKLVANLTDQLRPVIKELETVVNKALAKEKQLKTGEENARNSAEYQNKLGQ